MRKITTLLLSILFIGNLAYSQTEEKIYYDKNWKGCEKSEAEYFRIVSFNENNKPIGKIKDYYITGELQAEIDGALKIDKYNDDNSIFIGKEYGYSKSGIQTSMTIRSDNGGLRFQQTWYNDNHHMKKEVLFFNDYGEKDKYTLYDINGNQKEFIFYKNGEKYSHTCYYANGTRENTIFYNLNGKIKGYNLYYETGKEKIIIDKIDENPIRTDYYEDGQLKYEGTCIKEKFNYKEGNHYFREGYSYFDSHIDGDVFKAIKGSFLNNQPNGYCTLFRRGNYETYTANFINGKSSMEFIEYQNLAKAYPSKDNSIDNDDNSAEEVAIGGMAIIAGLATLGYLTANSGDDNSGSESEVESAPWIMNNVEIIDYGVYSILASPHVQVKVRNKNNYDVIVAIEMKQKGKWTNGSLLIDGTDMSGYDYNEKYDEEYKVKANSVRKIALLGSSGEATNVRIKYVK